jgi:hypothetical protein
MPSDTEIANLAISHLGVAKEIADLETEDSEEANTCRRFYTTALEATLRDLPWPFATKFIALALVEEDPTDEWDYSYRYPADCLKVRRILSGIRNDTRQSRAPYKISQDGSGRLILTDQQNAEIEYTVNETDEQKYPADFVLAFSFRLAMYAAARLTAGDPFKLKLEMEKSYRKELVMAGASAFTEEQIDEEPDSEYIRERE